MSDIAHEQQLQSPLERAQQYLSHARMLDAVHPLGQTILSAFEHDVIIAELEMEDETVTTNSLEVEEEIDLDSLLASDDVDKLEKELERRALETLALIGDTGDDDPGGYDRFNRDLIIRGNRGELATILHGKILLIRSRSNFVGVKERANVVLVGSMVEDYLGTRSSSIPPNPSLHTLSLKPFQSENGSWHWGSQNYHDVEQLGQIPNCYFDPSTFRGAYERSIGHARAYDVDLSDRTFDMPESGNPADIIINEPITRLDFIVKHALDAGRIQRRFWEIRFPKTTSSLAE